MNRPSKADSRLSVASGEHGGMLVSELSSSSLGNFWKLLRINRGRLNTGERQLFRLVGVTTGEVQPLNQGHTSD